MIEDSYRGVLLCALGCWFAGLVYLTAQEGAEDTSVPETQAPIQAQPVHPGALGAVPTDTTIPKGEPTFALDRPMTPGISGPGAIPPPAPMQPSNQAPKKPMGPTVSPMQSRGRLIQDMRPQRITVFPDDPESAWWEINPSYAFARAQREQRPLMLLFTGVWNTQAMALSEEVFSTKSFNEYVKENLVICYLNYPRNQTDAPDSLRRIKDKFKVRGYPNVLIFNPNGEVEKGIRGYRSGRPIDYFNSLKVGCLPVLESIKVQKAQMMQTGFRDWSNYLGKEIFARFVRHDTQHVVLQDASGIEWIIKINDLAPEDQKLVESFPRSDKIEIEGEDRQ